MAAPEVIFTRNGSVATAIREWIANSSVSLDAAVYRFNNPKLAAAVSEAMYRGITIRIVVDLRKYLEDPQTRQLLATGRFPVRLLGGRPGKGSKMHHKFAILDGRTVMTGSYNWTLESEEQNYDNLIIVPDVQYTAVYLREFELLWDQADPVAA